MPVEDFITLCNYFDVDDICRTIVGQPLRGRGFMPKLSDAEAVTLEIVGEFMGRDKGIWRYSGNHWHGWFPQLGSRATMPNKKLGIAYKRYAMCALQ